MKLVKMKEEMLEYNFQILLFKKYTLKNNVW